MCTLSLLTIACSHGAPCDFEFGGSCCGTPRQRQACVGVGCHLEIGDVAKRSCKMKTTSDGAHRAQHYHIAPLKLQQQRWTYNGSPLRGNLWLPTGSPSLPILGEEFASAASCPSNLGSQHRHLGSSFFEAGDSCL